MGRKSWEVPALVVVALVLTTSAQEARPQDERTAEEREHAAAWGAHHLCAGLSVVGRDYVREPAAVIEQDIAPAFRWEGSFVAASSVIKMALERARAAMS